MTQQQKDKLNKQLCGLLGINPKILSVMGGMMWEYPDFTSEVGRVQLLKIMMAREGSARFIIRIYEFNDHNSGAIHFANDIIDDNGALAIAARDFLKAMEAK